MSFVRVNRGGFKIIIIIIIMGLEGDDHETALPSCRSEMWQVHGVIIVDMGVWRTPYVCNDGAVLTRVIVCAVLFCFLRFAFARICVHSYLRSLVCVYVRKVDCMHTTTSNYIYARLREPSLPFSILFPFFRFFVF